MHVTIALLCMLHLFAPNQDIEPPSVVETAHLRVELVSEQNTILPGADFWVGLHFIPDEHWHIYWQNPGDTGLPPNVMWKLPQGLQADDISFPLPQRIPVGPLVNFGYESEVLLPIKIHTAASLPLNQPIYLEATVSWLVCAETCVPGFATVHTVVQAQQHAVFNPPWHDMLEKTRDNIPKQLDSHWQLSGTLDGNVLKIIFDNTTANIPHHAYFLPMYPLQIDHAAKQQFERLPHGFALTIPKSAELMLPFTNLAGVVVFDMPNGQTQGFVVNVPIHIPQHTSHTASVADISISAALLLALLGGLILNLMPCVFPVLSLKILGFLNMSHHSKKDIRKHAWMYTLGILVSFWALSGILLLLRSFGESLGWGFQLQSPTFVVLLASLLFLFSLHLLGVFQVGTSIMGVGQHLTTNKDLLSAFFTGVLATVVASPCTGPFMASAIGFALAQPAWVCLAIFTCLGFGLAMPYVLLCYMPQLIKKLPRPGRWMETLKESMGFFLLATVIWLIWVFAQQTSHVSADSIVIVLIDLLCLSAGAWLLHRFETTKWGRWAAVLCIILGLTIGIKYTTVPVPDNTDNKLTWEPFSADKVEQYQIMGQPVFVDFTAAWCVSCKVNEMLVFHSKDIQQQMKDMHVALLKADWTQRDPMITQTLASFGRSGVPLYILYDPNRDIKPIVLPEIITPSIVKQALDSLSQIH